MKRQQNFPLNLIHRSLPIPIFLNLKIDDRPPPFSPILNAGPRSTYRISSSDSNIHPLHVQTSSIFRFAVCKTVNGHICLLLRCRANGCKLHKRSAASVAVAWITSGTNLKIRMVAPWVEFQIQLLADSHDPVTSHLTLQGVICVPEVAWPFHLRKIQVFEFGRRDFSHDEGIATVALHYALDLIVAAISISGNTRTYYAFLSSFARLSSAYVFYTWRICEMSRAYILRRVSRYRVTRCRVRIDKNWSCECWNCINNRKVTLFTIFYLS